MGLVLATLTESDWLTELTSRRGHQRQPALLEPDATSRRTPCAVDNNLGLPPYRPGGQPVGHAGLVAVTDRPVAGAPSRYSTTVSVGVSLSRPDSCPDEARRSSGARLPSPAAESGNIHRRLPAPAVGRSRGHSRRIPCCSPVVCPRCRLSGPVSYSALSPDRPGSYSRRRAVGTQVCRGQGASLYAGPVEPNHSTRPDPHGGAARRVPAAQADAEFSRQAHLTSSSRCRPGRAVDRGVRVRPRSHRRQFDRAEADLRVSRETTPAVVASPPIRRRSQRKGTRAVSHWHRRRRLAADRGGPTKPGRRPPRNSTSSEYTDPATTGRPRPAASGTAARRLWHCPHSRALPRGMKARVRQEIHAMSGAADNTGGSRKWSR